MMRHKTAVFASSRRTLTTRRNPATSLIMRYLVGVAVVGLALVPVGRTTPPVHDNHITAQAATPPIEALVVEPIAVAIPAETPTPVAESKPSQGTKLVLAVKAASSKLAAEQHAKAVAEAKAQAEAAKRAKAASAKQPRRVQAATTPAPNGGTPQFKGREALFDEAQGKQEPPGEAPTATDPESNRALARQMAAERGWTGAQWDCLNQLWQKESRFIVNNGNPDKAYGIPQAKPGNKMAANGSDWRTNPRTQIAWGLDYIAGRYGNPCNAWAHSKRYNWY